MDVQFEEAEACGPRPPSSVPKSQCCGMEGCGVERAGEGGGPYGLRGRGGGRRRFQSHGATGQRRKKREATTARRCWKKGSPNADRCKCRKKLQTSDRVGRGGRVCTGSSRRQVQGIGDVKSERERGRGEERKHPSRISLFPRVNSLNHDNRSRHGTGGVGLARQIGLARA